MFNLSLKIKINSDNLYRFKLRQKIREIPAKIDKNSWGRGRDWGPLAGAGAGILKIVLPRPGPGKKHKSRQKLTKSRGWDWGPLAGAGILKIVLPGPGKKHKSRPYPGPGPGSRSITGTYMIIGSLIRRIQITNVLLKLTSLKTQIYCH